MTAFISALAQSTAHPATSGVAPWVADRGDGTYQNPVLYADYSDPDAIRVGEDYWMTSSSFSHVPGLPILHSRDLVNWTLVAHALPKLIPEDAFRAPQHGKGVWAPAIRHQAGKFWIYYPDPDFGIYLVTATDPRGPWSEPVLVKGGRGLIDPCPLWDDDGRVYLVHGWARSRSGVANALTMLELSADGTKVIDDFGYVLNGEKLKGYTTLEGPKLLKRDGWYYIFAPAGGVTSGWQSVFRSRTITGPWQDRIVLAQGSTPINGPHQGALVDTLAGEWWFLHFQDKGAYGRILHLQPVKWQDGWPLMGTGVATGGQVEVPVVTASGHPLVARGEPVLVHQKPGTGPTAAGILTPASSDDFSTDKLGLQWQWQANPRPEWFSLTARPGHLRLFAQPEPRPDNLYDAPQLLMQKFPAEEFSVTTKVEAGTLVDVGRAGMIVFGQDYAWIGLGRFVVIGKEHGPMQIVLGVCRDASRGGVEEQRSVPLTGAGRAVAVWLRVTVRPGGICRFAYSLDGVEFVAVGDEFTAKPDRWVGAKVGLFAALRPIPGAEAGHADFDFFEVGAIR